MTKYGMIQQNIIRQRVLSEEKSGKIHTRDLEDCNPRLAHAHMFYPFVCLSLNVETIRSWEIYFNNQNSVLSLYHCHLNVGSCVVIKLQLFKHSSSPLRLKEMQGQRSGCIISHLEEDSVKCQDNRMCPTFPFTCPVTYVSYWIFVWSSQMFINSVLRS